MIGEGEIDNSNNQIYSNSFNNVNPIHGNINEVDENENEIEDNFQMENEENFQHNSNLINAEEGYEQDDVYMMELHRKLGMMKQERKLAEKDSHLLFNRLRLLKNEEEKVIN
jgi:hypothetical protein